MRIECPGCAAAYDVPDSQIRPGRSVRCARCQLEWRPGGDKSEPPGPAPVAPSVPEMNAGVLRRPAEPMTEADIPAVPDRMAVRLALHYTGPGIGWAASLILLAGMLGSAVHWRGAIMHDWPPSARLYSAFGAHPRGS